MKRLKEISDLKDVFFMACLSKRSGKLSIQQTFAPRTTSLKIFRGQFQRDMTNLVFSELLICAQSNDSRAGCIHTFRRASYHTVATQYEKSSFFPLISTLNCFISRWQRSIEAKHVNLSWRRDASGGKSGSAATPTTPRERFRLAREFVAGTMQYFAGF